MYRYLQKVISIKTLKKKLLFFGIRTKMSRICNTANRSICKNEGRASDRAWAPVWQSRQGESHDGTRTYRPRTTVPAHVTQEMHQKQCSMFRIHIFLGLPDPDPLVRGMDPDPSIIEQK
jgi:hypothetical protein